MIAVETIEIVHLLLGNCIQNSMSEELMSFETAFGLGTVCVQKQLKLTGLHR